jgi:hypothetical protein
MYGSFFFSCGKIKAARISGLMQCASVKLVLRRKMFQISVMGLLCSQASDLIIRLGEAAALWQVGLTYHCPCRLCCCAADFSWSAVCLSGLVIRSSAFRALYLPELQYTFTTILFLSISFKACNFSDCFQRVQFARTILLHISRLDNVGHLVFSQEHGPFLRCRSK